MEALDIEGVNVLFPFKPYDIQLDYMKAIIKCLQQKTNGLLESPTGTGKTLCILCSTLGWLDSERLKKGIEFVERKKGKKGDKKSSKSLNGWELNGNDLPQVLYSSRTHSQLSQACKELKKTPYKGFKSVVIGSRDQLCINEEVSKLETISAKNQMCRHKIANKSCAYYHSYESKVDKNGDYTSTQVFDIEDLVKIGRKNTCCPYYASRYIRSKASLVFTPYNYILDPQIRQSNSLELKNAIVIFDEGHNIEKMCEESVSTELRSETFGVCIKHIDSVLQILKQIKEGSYVGVDAKEYCELEISDVARLKMMVCDLEMTIDSMIKESKSMKTLHETQIVFEIIDKIGIETNNSMFWSDLLDKISIILTNGSTLNQTQATVVSAAFKALIDFLEKLIPMKFITTEEFEKYKSDFIKKYKIFSQRGNEREDETKSFWNRKSDPDAWVLHVWCMSPSIGAKALLQLGVHSMIITSGTLAPIMSFEVEMDLNFPIKLQNTHIIGDNQLSIINISNARDGTLLTSKYDNRDNLHYYRALGQTFIELMRVVPKGVLVFFSSYTSMNKCIQVWKSSDLNIWGKINGIKQIFLEPRSRQTFSDCMTKYKLKVDEHNSNGALFFGVCRGKLSEGIDLPDDYCRCVIMTGLPFPSVADPRVMLKKQYLNEAKTKLSPDGWYTLQMKRALNQSIGRVIRHKDDFGVILLLDSRFSTLSDGLSKWVEKYIHKSRSKNIDQIIAKIGTFFAANSGTNCGYKTTDHFIPVNKTNKILSIESTSTQISKLSSEPNTSIGSQRTAAKRLVDEQTIINEYKSNEKQIVSDFKSIFDSMSSVITSKENNSKVFPNKSNSINELNESPLKRQKVSSPLKVITVSDDVSPQMNTKLQSIIKINSNSSTKKVHWNEEKNKIHEIKAIALDFSDDNETVCDNKDSDKTSVPKKEESPQTSQVVPKKSTQEHLEFWRKCGAELKELFKGSIKFSQLCESIKTYKKYKNLRLLAMNFNGVFEKLEDKKRQYFIRELSIIVPKTDYFSLLRLCGIEPTAEELAANKEFKVIERQTKVSQKSNS